MHTLLQCLLLPASFWFSAAQFGMTAVPLYAQSKQARGYEAFTRQSCPTFPLCESAAGLRCIIHEHSVNLLIQNMSSLFLCLIYYLFFLHSVIPSPCFSLSVVLVRSLPLLRYSISSLITTCGKTQEKIRKRDERKTCIRRWG